MGGTGQQINRANWTSERITAFRKYRRGDTTATFRGRKPNGDFYKKALSVSKLINYYKPLEFSFRKGAVHVTGGGFGPRKILTDDQVRAKAAAATWPRSSPARPGRPGQRRRCAASGSSAPS